jgi:hypothetical protein
MSRERSRERTSVLSQRAVSVLQQLKYREDAEWDVNILPFGSLFWKDEMPSMSDFFSAPEDLAVVFGMFGLRIRLWDAEVLPAADRELWETVRAQVPHWALFSRLNLSAEQSLARQQAERQVEREFESFFVDDAGISQH